MRDNIFLSTPSARRATSSAFFMPQNHRFLSTPSARRATGWPCRALRPCSDFYPRPPRGGRPAGGPGSFHGRQISIHALREEGDAAVNDLLQRHNISIHALREEGDPFRHRSERVKEDFYPRPPRGGRHQTTLTAEMYRKFLSTPSARRATRARPSRENRPEISIHALREEGDPFSAVRFWLQKVFLSTPSARRATLAACAALHADAISIHALREEGDSSPFFKGKIAVLISIHALREEGDGRASSLPTLVVNFYPRPPRGGRLRFGLCAALPVHISIHALREEGDPQLERGKLPVTNYFYPRPPRGGRRSACRRKLRCCPISIHALREEGDCRHARDHAVQLNFYPRPPRGGRQYLYRSYHTLGGFLSTPSARRATPTATTSLNSRKNFYPRPPRGGRPVVVLQHVGFHQFLSTPSARRATLKTTITTNVGGISIHALREEGDRRAFLQGRLPVYFYPRPPRGGRHFTDPEDTCPG